MKKCLLIFITICCFVFPQLVAQGDIGFENYTQPNCATTLPCNGTATLDGYGGQPPYVYIWPNGAIGSIQTDLCTSTYSVTMTDAIGNMDVRNVYVGSNLDDTFDLTGDVDCSSGGQNNGAITLTTADSTLTYQWSNGSTQQNLTNLPVGNYSVTATDARGCTRDLYLEINNLDTPPTFTVNTCNGSILIDTVGNTNGHDIYQWQIIAPNGLIYFNQTALNNLLPGDYILKLFSSCGEFEQNFTIV
jgi:hypothetical protein